MKESLTPGQFLRKLRKSKGLYGKQAAKKAGISASLLSRIERDQLKITPKSTGELVIGYGMNQKEEEQFKELIRTGNLVLERSGLDELRMFYELIRLEKPIRERIIKAALAYDSVGSNAE